MSDALQAKIQRTIDEHVAEEGGGFVTAWHLIAEYIDTEGEESWLYATADNQKAMTTIGLIEWARGVTRYEQHRYLDAIADE